MNKLHITMGTPHSPLGIIKQRLKCLGSANKLCIRMFTITLGDTPLPRGFILDLDNWGVPQGLPDKTMSKNIMIT
jgi:hypothetical protein